LRIQLFSFGAGFIPSQGATFAANGQTFNFVCTNNVPNIRIRSNYLLTALNPTFQRTLNTVTDIGALGFGATIAPYANPPASFASGQSMCNIPAQTPINTFSFPAFGTALPGAPVGSL
jgi:hypothetical protein